MERAESAHGHPLRVFLSHAGADTLAARQLADTLRRNGLDVWFDKDSLPPGTRWMEALETAIEASDAMVVYVGRSGVQTWVDREVRLGLERNTQAPQHFKLIPAFGDGFSALSALPPFLRQQQGIDLRDRQNAPGEIQRLIDALKSTAEGSTIPSEYWETHSPFRSLREFNPEDSWLFFGRDSEVLELLGRLDRGPVVAVLGNSGSGKSSLIRAGLMPALHRGRFEPRGFPVESWRIAVFRPTASPFHALAEGLPPLMTQPKLEEVEAAVARWKVQLAADTEGLRNAIVGLRSTAAQGMWTAGTRVLLVVDQFEEIFTLTKDKAERDRYINALLAAARLGGEQQVHLVFALRADFYSHCLDHPELSRLLESNLYNVSLMGRDQLKAAIEKPLALAGARADESLIDSLLDDAGAEPGNLALLEHALGQLWDQRDRASSTLTFDVYKRIGGLKGSLGRHADTVLAGITDEQEKKIAAKIFLELVQLGEGAQDTRRRVGKEVLYRFGDASIIDKLLVVFASQRLIATGGQGPVDPRNTFVEVSHEALIREWPTLRSWLEESRADLRLERRLLDMASDWERLNRDPGALLRGSQLAQAEEWFAEHPRVTSMLAEFMAASRGEKEKADRLERETRERELAHERQLQQAAEARAQVEEQLRREAQALVTMKEATANRTRRFLYALACLFVMAAAAALYAYNQQRTAESRALAARAETLFIQGDVGEALKTARQALSWAKTTEAHSALTHIFPQGLVKLEGHFGWVNHAAFSPDGQRILTASFDRTARVWNAATGQLLAKLEGHSDSVLHAAFSPDGQRIVSASADKTARVWTSANGQLLAKLEGHSDWVNHAAFSPDGQRIVSASADKTARVWSSANGQLLAKLEGHSDRVFHAAFSPDGQRIVSASADNTARVWTSANGQLLAKLEGHSGRLFHAAFSPDGQRIVSASADRTARVWNAANGQLLAKLEGHSSAVNHAAFSPDGQRILTASFDRTARVWNVATGQLLAKLEGHFGWVNHAAFSPDGQRILTASFDRTARVWNAATGQLLAKLEGHSDSVFHAAFSPDGQRIVTASEDKTARVWNSANGQLLAKLEGHSDWVNHAAFSPDGQRIVSASEDKTARVWSSANGQLLAKLEGHSDRVNHAAFSPDGQRIVSASEDNTARVWTSANGQLLAKLEGHSSRLFHAAFSPDGQRILSASADRTARVWSSANGQLLAKLEGHSSAVLHAAFSPDGQRILTASFDRTARVWNAATGQLLAKLEGHSDRVNHAAFSPDGQRILTASFDRTARVWNAATGQLLAKLEGHSDSVFHAAFSPDGQRILSASADNTARVWNSANGQLLAKLEGHSGRLFHAAFSPDGQRIVTASEDKTARVWNSANGQLLAKLEGHSNAVNHAAFSPDGQRILSASADNTARVWRVVTWAEIIAELK